MAHSIDVAMIADYEQEWLTDESVKKIEALKGKEYDREGVWAAHRSIIRVDQVLSGPFHNQRWA